MKRSIGWGTTMGMVLALTLAAPAAGQQTQQQQVARQQHMQQMHERMHHLEQMSQRMERVQEQIRNMNQMLQQDMDRLRAQNQEQNQSRIRQTERVRDMGEAMGLMAQQMRQTMLQLREMEGDPGASGDPQMLRHMEQLREHLRVMSEGMEEGLKIMEQLHQRLRAGGPGGT